METTVQDTFLCYVGRKDARREGVQCHSLPTHLVMHFGQTNVNFVFQVRKYHRFAVCSTCMKLNDELSRAKTAAEKSFFKRQKEAHKNDVSNSSQRNVKYLWFSLFSLPFHPFSLSVKCLVHK